MIITGEGLHGDAWFPLAPNSSATYELIYRPMQEGKSKGSIAFIHPILGEIWYEFNLMAEDKGGIRLPHSSCELGKVDKHEVIIDNPLAKEVPFSVEVTNDANFAFIHPFMNMKLPPNSHTSCLVQFTPSTLFNHSGEILIQTKEVGKWLFICSGTGESPNPYEAHEIFCKIGGNASDVIEFRNPMKDALNVILFYYFI